VLKKKLEMIANIDRQGEKEINVKTMRELTSSRWISSCGDRVRDGFVMELGMELCWKI
jgi:hypothetical protein